MARLPRLVIPHQQHHVLQRALDGKAVFQHAEDCQFFLNCLRDASRLYRVAVHAYVLMPDHFHLLVTPTDDVGLGKMMQWLGRQFVPFYNLKYQRSGTLWQGRFRATVLESSTYFLPCSLYIESNPLRAGLIADVGDLIQFPWSSYSRHVGVKNDPLIADHPLYWALGNTPFQREAAYKDLMQSPISQKHLDSLTDATQKGWLLGSESFSEEMGKLTDRRVKPAQRGRPRK
jgi:putative transposase